jgi:hypothetical protein
VGSCQHGNEPSGSIKDEFIGWLIYYLASQAKLCSMEVIKVKVVPVLFLNLAPRHEGVLGEWRYRSTHSLTLALDGGE